MKFKLTIDCDNAAFVDPLTDDPVPEPEIARILGYAIQYINLNGLYIGGDSIKVRDANGNTVGEFELTD